MKLLALIIDNQKFCIFAHPTTTDIAMIHTIKIDDNTPNGKRIIEELRNNYKDVEFVESNVSEPVPDGYMTGQEFRTKVKSKIHNHYKENGLI